MIRETAERSASASRRIARYIERTPLRRSTAFSDSLQADIYFKLENRQTTGSFKLRGRRIFRMSPLHHHFELKGWPEPKVIVRFWIITVILVLVGLSSLKIR